MNTTAAVTSWPEKIISSLTRLLPGVKPGRAAAVSPREGSAAEEPTAATGLWTGFSRKPEDLATTKRDRDQARPLNILVPVDFSQASSRALDCALEMAVSHRTSITLLHAINLNLAPIGPANPAEQKISLCQEALAKAGPFLERARETGFTAACVVDEGSPAKAIAGAARRCRPDVIILSKQPRSKWAGWLGAGTVERVTRQAACPVLVLPA